MSYRAHQLHPMTADEELAPLAPPVLGEQLRYLLSFAAQHPELSAQRRRWPANPFTTLRAAWDLLACLPAKPRQPCSMVCAYTPAVRSLSAFQPAAIAALRQQLGRDLGGLATLGRLPGEDLLAALRRHHAALTFGTKPRPRAVRGLLRCLPVLFHADGPAPVLLADLSDQDLVRACATTLYELTPLLEQRASQAPYGEYLDACRKVVAAFERTLGLARGGLKAFVATAGARLQLTEVAVPGSVFRGLIADDCATERIPFHALLPEVATYWVESGEPLAVHGYILTVTVEWQGRSYPYLLSVASELCASAPECLPSLLEALAARHGSDGVFIPTLADPDNDELCNYPKVTEALLALARPEVHVLRLPAAWAWVDARTRELCGAHLKNCYQLRPSIQRALFVPRGEAPFPAVLLKPGMALDYHQGPRVEDIPLTVRARLAADSVAGLRAERARRADYAEVSRVFGMGQEEVDLAWLFFHAAKRSGLNKSEFSRIQSRLPITLNDVAVFPAIVAARSLLSIHAETPQLTSERQWAQLYRAVRAPFEQNIAGRTRLPRERTAKILGESVWMLLCLEAYTPAAFRSAFLAGPDFTKLMPEAWFWRSTFGSLGPVFAFLARLWPRPLPLALLVPAAVLRLRLTKAKAPR